MTTPNARTDGAGSADAGAVPAQRVLVIEDDPVLRRAVLSTLTGAGFQAEDAADAAAGMHLVRSHRPDLILCDIHLGQHNGFGVLSELRQDPGTAAIPVILMTGDGDPRGLRRGMDEGADDYLHKPFAAAELLTAINARLKKQQVWRDRARQTTQRLLSILEATADLVVLADPETLRLTHLNRAGREVLGDLAAEDDARGYLTGLYPESERARLREHRVPEAIARGSSVAETIMLGRQGQTILVSQQILAHRAPDGRLDFLSVVARDITASKAAEAALRESEERFRTITSAAQDAIMMVDSTGLVRFWNAAAERVFGRRTDQVLGHSFSSLMATGTNSRVVEETLQRLAGHAEGPGTGRLFELAGRRTDGAEFPLELSFSTVRLQGQWHAVVIARDISQRKRSEEYLRLLTSAVEAAASGIAITDAEGTVLWVNPAFCRLTGYGAAEVLGRQNGLWRTAEPGGEPPAGFWSTISSGRAWRGVMASRRKDGSPYREEMTVTPVLSSSGVVRHCIAIKQESTSPEPQEPE